MALASDLDHERPGWKNIDDPSAGHIIRGPVADARPVGAFDSSDDLGLSVPDGRLVNSLADAEAAAESIGYPVFLADLPRRPIPCVRASPTMSKNCANWLPADACPGTTIDDLRIERALTGHLEVEVELLRDGGNHMQLVAMAENMEPAGIHSGDSLVVIPM
jgi:carbamoyl-phosphate synthase large subunit